MDAQEIARRLNESLSNDDLWTNPSIVDDVEDLADEYDALTVENERLKILVRHMHMCTERIEGFGVYYDCDNCVLDGTRECDFEERMRELGIEVE